MKIAVMTDSTAYIPRQIRESESIHMVPLNVVFGEVSYQEEVDLSTGEFYHMVKQSENLPKTSQPSIGSIIDKLEMLAMDYDAVISVHLSSGISGTYQAVVSAGKMVEGITVYPFDSEISCLPQGFYALEAAKMARENALPGAIIDRLEQMKQNMCAYFMVDDLSHLQRGGRLNGAQVLVGSLLQIKPLLHFVDKQIVPFEKIRTRKKALNRIIGLLEEDINNGKPVKVAIIHGNAEQKALEMKRELEEKHPSIDCQISYFGPVIGTHLGSGSIGIGWYIV
ncbi:fatty acid-binding protein DegV [Virgibacillus phasianinus]|uniref:Fatty acid-binding protein DegV n=1 Tax=Virgibacillus phasianinus TaxID=2017483 RepID=A0A220U3P3_9BACI|nr:DegV family protein [Virgibacillus phasianinus]ASK62720.1 fatty acid-binding protein DegV [Virgibacillus phasianinus]